MNAVLFSESIRSISVTGIIGSDPMPCGLKRKRYSRANTTGSTSNKSNTLSHEQNNS
jgi:hypothetical protein